MKADHVAYRKATNVCLLGLTLQFAMTLAMFLFAYYARDHASLTAAGFIGLGLLPWLALAIVFDQHRRERLEAVEIESFAQSDAASASVFETSEAELRVAAKRLGAMHRFLLPAVSILYGAGLLTLGYWRLQSGRPLYNATTFPETAINAGWGMGVGLMLAFVGFIFARFVAGMAKQRAWANIRGGAAAAVGAALFGLALAVALFVDQIGPDTVRRILVVAFPVAMMVLGAEVFANFLLEIYRPRKAGEAPHPAFDSRILSFIAAPDVVARSIGEALEYQFGFEVRKTWMYQFLATWLPFLVVFCLLVAWALSCVVVLEPHQRGMLLRYGRIVDPDLGPGLHVKAPWPFEQVVIPEYLETDDRGRKVVASRTATGVRVLNLGTPPEPDKTRPVLWTEKHAREEAFFLCQPSTEEGGSPATGDLALVAVEAPVQYAVSNVELYETVSIPEHRSQLLKAVAQRELLLSLSSVSVDDAIGPKRTPLNDEIERRIADAFDRLETDPTSGRTGSGVDVLFFGLESIHPPQEVAKAYQRILLAEQNQRKNLYEAEAERIRSLTRVVGSVDLAERIMLGLEELDDTPSADTGARAEKEFAVQRLLEEAGGESASRIARASAERWERHMADRGRAALYQGQLAAYRASPLYYQSSLYFKALRSGLERARVYITSPDVSVRFMLEEPEQTTVFDETEAE